MIGIHGFLSVPSFQEWYVLFVRLQIINSLDALDINGLETTVLKGGVIATLVFCAEICLEIPCWQAPSPNWLAPYTSSLSCKTRSTHFFTLFIFIFKCRNLTSSVSQELKSYLLMLFMILGLVICGKLSVHPQVFCFVLKW